MATKTITLDLEAYRRLRRAKRGTESFSEAIKRIVPEPLDFDAWVATLRKNRLSADAIDAIEDQVRSRALRSRPSRPGRRR